MGAEQQPKRHRVHHGLTGARLPRAAVMLEIWVAPPDDPSVKPYHRCMLTSAEWVDLIAGVIVGDLETSATDLNALRSDIARMHERWRASLERASVVVIDPDGVDAEDEP